MGFDNERIKITLNIFYSDIVPEDKQDPLLAFVRTSLTNPNVTLVAQEHEEDQTPVSDADSGKQVNYQFEGLSEFLAYVPISQAKGVSVAWVEGKDYRENFDKAYKLLDERRYLDAIPLYKKCLAVNPVAFRARLELLTCYTMLGQYGKAHEQVKALSQYRMPTPILAAFYRRYGYLLAEEGKNLASYACYQYSLGFESSDLARGEIEYLSSIMREDLSKYDTEEIMRQNDIPFLESMPELDLNQNS